MYGRPSIAVSAHTRATTSMAIRTLIITMTSAIDQLFLHLLISPVRALTLSPMSDWPSACPDRRRTRLHGSRTSAGCCAGAAAAVQAPRALPLLPRALRLSASGSSSSSGSSAPRRSSGSSSSAPLRARPPRHTRPQSPLRSRPRARLPRRPHPPAPRTRPPAHLRPLALTLLRLILA